MRNTHEHDNDAPIDDLTPADVIAPTLIGLLLVSVTVMLFGQFVVRPLWWVVFGH